MLTPEDRGAAHGVLAADAASFRAVDLTLSFGERAILSRVSADVQPGVVTALIGPTGSGKTTLLRTLNRMNDKVAGYRHAGDVLLGGRSIWHPAVELMSLRRRVGRLFQRPNPFPMSIFEKVVSGARAHRLAGRKDLKSRVCAPSVRSARTLVRGWAACCSCSP